MLNFLNLQTSCGTSHSGNMQQITFNVVTRFVKIEKQVHTTTIHKTKAQPKYLHKRVVQYTRTDTTRIMAFTLGRPFNRLIIRCSNDYVCMRQPSPTVSKYRDRAGFKLPLKWRLIDKKSLTSCD